MDGKLRSLYDINDTYKLQDFVKSYSFQKLSTELETICLKEDGAFILEIIFKGLTNSAVCQEKKGELSNAVLNIIQIKALRPALANKLLNVLVSELQNIPVKYLVELINTCLKAIQKTKEVQCTTWWKNIVPQLLNLISDKPIVEQNGTVMSGSEFKSQIVTAILMNEWDPKMITNISTIFVDLPLSSDEHLKIINKLCHSIQKIPLNEIPPLTYQLLQLSKEQNSIPLFIALADYFDFNLYNHIEYKENENISLINLKDRSIKEVQIMEGTVLYHIFAAANSLSPKSVKDFVKKLKECINYPQFIIRPFFITVLLNISGIAYSFEEEILNLLTSCLVRLITEENKAFDSAWLESFVHKDINAESILKKIIQNCYRDRDRIINGLINLGFSLLAVKTKGKESNTEEVWKIGTSLLLNVVQKYSHVTPNIFQNLVDQISQVHDATQYTDCLRKIANKHPLNLLDCSSLILQVLGSICVRVSTTAGQRILAAILPLTKLSSSFRDNLIIFLRKALFSDQSSRKLAVYGFLELLKDLRITNVKSLSQSISQSNIGITQMYSCSFNTAVGCISNEGICIEILEILRQALENHQEVKMTFYKGVYDSFYVNPKLGIHILEILKSRLDKLLKKTNGSPSLDFNEIPKLEGSSVTVKEPVANLVIAMALIAAKSENESFGKFKFSDILIQLCDLMADSDIHHFDLEKENFDSILDDVPDNPFKQEKIRQILGVYEALIGFLLCWKGHSSEYGQKIYNLFKGYSRITDYAKSMGKMTRKKQNDKFIPNDLKDSCKGKEKAKAFKFPPTVLNLKCGSRLLALINNEPVKWASEEMTEVLKGKRELHRYAYNVILELLDELRNWSPGERSRNKYTLQYISYIGRILYSQCLLRLSQVREFDSQCPSLAMECFHNLLNLICCYYKVNIQQFLSEIGLSNNDIKVQLNSLVDSVLEQMSELLENEENEIKEEAQTKKLSLLLISISSLLIGLMPQGIEIQQVMKKIKLICKEKKIQNPIVAKALLGLLLNIYIKIKSPGTLIFDLVLCLCDSITLIDDEMEVDEHEKYAIINPETASNCLLVICEAVHTLNSEIEWMLARCKSELLVAEFSSDEIQETKQQALIDREKVICRLLNYNIKVLSMICTIAVPPGTLADAVLKEIGNVYSNLVLATKYFSFKLTKFNQTFLSARFERTVKMADHELTKNMYCFTQHIIADGSASKDDLSIIKHKKEAMALKNKVLKETKIIPKVIYEKEQFQKYIMQLSNKSKIDLETKRTMARDYRLRTKQVSNIIEKGNQYIEDVDLNDPEESEENTALQTSKKLRLTPIEE